jgi:hypothetical protein
MSPSRKVALWGGVMYLITFIASIPQFATFADLVDDPAGFVTSTGSSTAVRVGSWLEIVTALSCIGTAIALYPITRRVSRAAAIGFVSSRTLEAAVIMAGTMCVLAVVTLQSDFAGVAGTDSAALGLTGTALVDVRQMSFLIGPGVVPGINALFLGYIMYKSRLVPRIIPTIGLVGAPLILTSATVTILGGWDQVSPAATLLALPIAVWEFSLGVYMTFWGFRRTRVTDAVDAEAVQAGAGS